MKDIRLTKEELDCIKAILKQLPPEYSVYAFGSRVKGKVKPFSDLDLVIVADEPIPAITMYNIQTAFEESYLPFKVDLLDWFSISEEFKQHIKNGWYKIQ